jgi:hypothetical protein
MFCPRCGAENDEESRYCASCGTELARKAKAPAGAEEEGGGGQTFGERVRGLIGRDRRTRMVTLGTVAAIAVAVGAFLALSPSGEGSDVPQDSYTRLVDAACVQRKAEIAKAQGAALGAGGLAAVRNYADAIVPIAGEWRGELRRGAVPPDRTDLVDALTAALLEVQIEAGTLARVARESDAGEVTRAAAQMDAATANVEAAVDSLGLQRCGQLTIAQGRLVRQ